MKKNAKSQSKHNFRYMLRLYLWFCVQPEDGFIAVYYSWLLLIDKLCLVLILYSSSFLYLYLQHSGPG
jgi:hypothetical protein